MKDARVDEYIAKSAPFAREVLTKLRMMVHRAAPDVEETIKWGMPFFLSKGKILGNMAAFKAHCSFGLWGGGEMAAALRRDGVLSGEGMGSLGKIGGIDDLPSDDVLLGYLKQALALVESGGGKKKVARPAATRETIVVPEDLAAALRKNKAAKATFEAFSPSRKREYTEWVAEAKRPETRERRVLQAMEWMAEGKDRNWKYKQS